MTKGKEVSNPREVQEDTLDVVPRRFKKRVQKIFSSYGDDLRINIYVGTIIVHAAKKRRLRHYLNKLQKHWQENVFYQAPEVRGTHSVNVDFFEDMFEELRVGEEN